MLKKFGSCPVVLPARYYASLQRRGSFVLVQIAQVRRKANSMMRSMTPWRQHSEQHTVGRPVSRSG